MGGKIVNESMTADCVNKEVRSTRREGAAYLGYLLVTAVDRRPCKL